MVYKLLMTSCIAYKYPASRFLEKFKASDAIAKPAVEVNGPKAAKAEKKKSNKGLPWNSEK